MRILSYCQVALYRDVSTTEIVGIHRSYLIFRANLQIADNCATLNVAKNSI